MSAFNNKDDHITSPTIVTQVTSPKACYGGKFLTCGVTLISLLPKNEKSKAKFVIVISSICLVLVRESTSTSPNQRGLVLLLHLIN